MLNGLLLFSVAMNVVCDESFAQKKILKTKATEGEI